MALPPTTLERLRVFHAVASCGTIAGAARTLGYTPSAVSQHVSALEREMGATLVERSNRGVTVTAAGRTLAQRASDIVDLVRTAADETLIAAGRRSAELTIAAFPTAITAILLPLRHRLESQVNINIVDAEAEPALQALVERQVDGAITDGYAVEPWERSDQFRRTVLLVEPLRLITRRGDERSRLDEFGEDVWVLGAPSTRLGRVSRDACHAAGFEPKVVIETVDHHVTFDGIRAGASSILPALALTALPLDVMVVDVDLGLERRIEFVTRGALYDNPVVALFTAHLAQMALCWP